MTLSAFLTNRGGVGQGVLEGHPAGVEVQTRRVGGRLRIALLQGAQEIGDGLLQAERGWWRGVCREFAATWYVSGRCGSGEFRFSETAEPGP
jgi:hypothetical protein